MLPDALRLHPGRKVLSPDNIRISSFIRAVPWRLQSTFTYINSSALNVLTESRQEMDRGGIIHH